MYECTVCTAAGSQFDVGVLEDNRTGLATQLQRRELFASLPAKLAMMLPTIVLPVKLIFLMPGWAMQEWVTSEASAVR